jgi:PPOX class probable FMN-dependent enzyme
MGEHAAVITDEAELRALLGQPIPRVAHKVRRRLHDLDRQWLAASPFCLVATSAVDGTCDVSPKGDPPGFVHVLDDNTIVVPERPGNRRGDGYRNLLTNPQVGLLFVVPGRGDTLRINGRARLLRDAPYFDELTVKGHRPLLAMEIAIEEVFYHCSKAFLRSSLWNPESWTPEALPSRAVIAHTLEANEQSVEELEQYYGPSYAEKLYVQRM